MDENRVTASEKKTITLADGKEYIVRKMTLGDAKKLLPAIQKMDELRGSGNISIELIDSMIDVAYQILVVENKEVTKESLTDILELDTVPKLISITTGVA